MWTDLSSFYTSKIWIEFLNVLKHQRADENGDIICEHCGKKIPNRAFICIGHHKEELTLENVNDYNISLNPDNVALVHFKCHNIIHNRFGRWQRHIYLVYGCPLAGKSEWVKENAGQHDLIVEIDRIYSCINNQPLHSKSGRIADNVFAVRDLLLDMIKTRRGKWVNAFIIGGYPFSGERERLCAELGAEPIFIECDKETALQRLASLDNGVNASDMTKYIEQWFERYNA